MLFQKEIEKEEQGKVGKKKSVLGEKNFTPPILTSGTVSESGSQVSERCTKSPTSRNNSQTLLNRLSQIQP